MQRYTYGDTRNCDESSPRRAVRCLVDSHGLSFFRFFVPALSLRPTTPQKEPLRQKSTPSGRSSLLGSKNLTTEAIPHGAGRGGSGGRNSDVNFKPNQVCIFLWRWNGGRQRQDERRAGRKRRRTGGDDTGRLAGASGLHDSDRGLSRIYARSREPQD